MLLPEQPKKLNSTKKICANYKLLPMIETFNKAKRQKIVINSNQRIARQYQGYMRNFNKLRKQEQLNRKPSKTYEQGTHRKLSVSN